MLHRVFVPFDRVAQPPDNNNRQPADCNGIEDFPWLVEKLWAYQIPEDIATERGVQLTDEIKEKILGLNAARLYDVDIAARKAEFAAHPMLIAAE